MNAVEKALWVIESHFAGEITLLDIANTAGVSRFHMTRAFGAATGHSIMRYVRGRRLTEAAKALSHGAPDILAVALDAGYGSHEAFTRAFRQQFGLTPDELRERGDAAGLDLMEALRMDDTTATLIAPPRVVRSDALLVFGLGQRYVRTNAGIPSQWNRF